MASAISVSPNIASNLSQASDTHPCLNCNSVIVSKDFRKQEMTLEYTKEAARYLRPLEVLAYLINNIYKFNIAHYIWICNNCFYVKILKQFFHKE